jgi:hypothetical protein
LTDEDIKSIADTLEFFKYCVYGLICAGGIVAIVFGFMFLVPIIYDVVVYDWLDYPRPTYSTPTTYNPPIDDCNYSEDRQLCFQMERVADALGNNP